MRVAGDVCVGGSIYDVENVKHCRISLRGGASLGVPFIKISHESRKPDLRPLGVER
jgi:hypothetical protein